VLAGAPSENDANPYPLHLHCTHPFHVRHHSPASSISSSSMMLNLACTVSRIKSMSSRTSRALAVPRLMMKLACCRETIAPPTRLPFRPAFSMRKPAGYWSVRLKMLPALNPSGCLSLRRRLYSAALSWMAAVSSVRNAKVADRITGEKPGTLSFCLKMLVR